VEVEGLVHLVETEVRPEATGDEGVTAEVDEVELVDVNSLLRERIVLSPRVTPFTILAKFG